VTIDTYQGFFKEEGHVIIRGAVVGENGAFRSSLCPVFAEVTVQAVVSWRSIRFKTVMAYAAGVR
jgi:hypothetical protein